jgi:hypothetical protein
MSNAAREKIEMGFSFFASDGSVRVGTGPNGELCRFVFQKPI